LKFVFKISGDGKLPDREVFLTKIQSGIINLFGLHQNRYRAFFISVLTLVIYHWNMNLLLICPWSIDFNDWIFLYVGLDRIIHGHWVILKSIMSIQ
jgi:hypothetical protein